jgi:Type II secretory pathway, component PulD
LLKKTRVKILSTPTLLVLNNHPASIDVGTQVPVINSQATSINVPSTTGGAGIIPKRSVCKHRYHTKRTSYHRNQQLGKPKHIPGR